MKKKILMFSLAIFAISCNENNLEDLKKSRSEDISPERFTNEDANVSSESQLTLSSYSTTCFTTPIRFGSNESWTSDGAFKGDIRTALSDVTGDGKSDIIAVNYDKIYVRRSNGSRFLANEMWTSGPFKGDAGRNYFADVTGDGKADAIVANNDKIYVRRSTGSAFSPNEIWTSAPFVGELLQGFYDVSGDGKADAVILNYDRIYVRLSTGSSFGPVQRWNFETTTGGISRWHFSDIDGDGRKDIIGIGCGFVYALSQGNSFSSWHHVSSVGNCSWAVHSFANLGGGSFDFGITSLSSGMFVSHSFGVGGDPYSTSSQAMCDNFVSNGAGLFFGDVTGDGRADALVFNKTETVVRRSINY